MHHKHHGGSQQPRSPLCGGLVTTGSTGHSSPFHSTGLGSSAQQSLRCGNTTKSKCISGRNSRNHSPHEKIIHSDNHRTPTDSTIDGQTAAKNLPVCVKPRSQSLKYDLRLS